MKTKRLSLFLAFVMILSVFSGMFVVNAGATPTYPTLSGISGEIPEGMHWCIGEPGATGTNYYATFKEAIAGANGLAEATTIYMLADHEEAFTTSTSKVSTNAGDGLPDITIVGVTQSDGSKPVMTPANCRWIRWDPSTATDLTIQNIEVNVPTATHGVFQFDKKASTVTLQDVDITYGKLTSATYGIGAIVTSANLNIIDCNIKMTEAEPLCEISTTNYSLGAVVCVNVSGPKINIINSTLDASAATNNYKLVNAVTKTNVAEITIQDSTLNAPSYSALDPSFHTTAKLSTTLIGTNVINGVTYKSTEMLDGAAVRIVDDGNDGLTNSGLRFMSTVSADAIAAAGENATYGTVIFRDSDYTEWMAENAGKTMADFIAAANDSEEDELKVADIKVNTGKVENADGSYTLFAALVNIKESNYNTDFGAVSYIKFNLGSSETIIYSEFVAEDHVRSITEVAAMALADTSTEQGYEEDGYKYNYLVSEGVYSPYTDDQRALLNKYLGN